MESIRLKTQLISNPESVSKKMDGLMDYRSVDRIDLIHLLFPGWRDRKSPKLIGFEIFSFPRCYS